MQKEISEEKRIEWEIKIIDQKKSGLSITDWCRKHQIGYGGPQKLDWSISNVYSIINRPNFWRTEWQGSIRATPHQSK